MYSPIKAFVIVHGKSEFQMCNYCKMVNRLKIEVIGDKNGEKSITIHNILSFLNKDKFCSETNFKSYWEDVWLDDNLKHLNKGLKIFIIMDKDDCTEEEFTQFVNKDMFKKHWAYKYIIPIYNNKNLEEILTKAGIQYTKKSWRGKKTEYVNIFPTTTRDINHQKGADIEEVRDKLKKVNNTNMEEIFSYCLDNKVVHK